MISDDRWTCPRCGLTVAVGVGARQYGNALVRMARDTHLCDVGVLR